MRLLSLAAALLVAGPAFAQGEVDALVPDFVYLVGLPGVKNEDLDAYASSANDIYKRLNLAVRAKRLEHPKTFMPTKLPERSSYVLIGSPGAIKTYIKVADPAISYIWDDWLGVADREPERSQNRFYTFKGKERKGGGRLITMDVAGPDFYRLMGPCSAEDQKRINKERGRPADTPILKPWTKAQAGGLIIVHGSGHNSDFDFGLDHYGMGVMVDGNALGGYLAQGNLMLWDKDFAVITSPDRNVALARYLKSRFDDK